MVKEIICQDCAKRGKHKVLGKVIQAEGIIKLWCNSCKEEKIVTIANDKITTKTS
jgi:hypothetical protein